MANQYKIFPISRLENVEVDLAGVKTVADFEVIEILDDKDPYPTLLGIEWAFDNATIINLKKEFMLFEADGTRVIQPLYPYQGPWYTKPVNEAMEGDTIDQLYHLTTGRWADYINPTTDELVSWWSINSFYGDSEEAF